MLDYLVTSTAKRRLLRLLWLENRRGSVSGLARLGNLNYRSAHKELNDMARAGLANCSRFGNVTVFAAVKDHPNGGALRKLLRVEKSVVLPDNSRSHHFQKVRSWLVTLGAPLPGRPTSESLPAVEKVLVEGVGLSHYDASVARSLPVCFWKNKDRLDFEKLLLEAMNYGLKQSVGFFLELTGTLGRDNHLCEVAKSFRDHRVRKEKSFFLTKYPSKFNLELQKARSPLVARNWFFLMNMSEETFASTFRKFVNDANISA